MAQEELLESIALARQILELVEDKQATNIVLLDVHEQTTLTDYFLIATVDNLRQARAIEQVKNRPLATDQAHPRWRAAKH